MGAIEDALISRDFRALKAWGLAIAVAAVSTLAAARLLALDLDASVFTSRAFNPAGSLLGGMLFGFGMALAGTCSFGLLVRAGAGDMRAMVCACVVGIAAFAMTAGPLAPLLGMVTALEVGQPPLPGNQRLPVLLSAWMGTTGPTIEVVATGVVAVVLMLAALADRRLRRRPRLIISSVVVGAAVALGWAATGRAVEELETTRLESLSFVAPVGRLLLAVMGSGLREVGFGTASVIGVLCGAFAVAALKRELRAEAFDDPREMRRHLAGAVLMGAGGVLARGCTVGQGLSAASILAISVPVMFAGVLIGAKIGLMLLLEGRSAWRLGA